MRKILFAAVLTLAALSIVLAARKREQAGERGRSVGGAGPGEATEQAPARQPRRFAQVGHSLCGYHARSGAASGHPPLQGRTQVPAGPKPAGPKKSHLRLNSTSRRLVPSNLASILSA